jgi:cold shock CspA family protein
MAESFNKKELEKKKQKKQKDKEAKKEERKAGGGKKKFEDMIAYVDEYGNIVDTPPDLTKKEVINAEDIEIGVPKKTASDDDNPDFYKGTVTFFNDQKGFGFIKAENGESVFVHVNNLSEKIKENDKVLFDVEHGPKGLNAVNVKLDK